MTIFNGGNNNGAAMVMKEKTLASGRRTVSYVSKKDYGIEYGLKGAELRRAHERYRMNVGVRGNAGLTGLIATGQVLVQKITETKNGFNAAFVRASVLDVDKTPKELAATMTDEQLAEFTKEAEARAAKAKAAADAKDEQANEEQAAAQ